MHIRISLCAVLLLFFTAVCRAQGEYFVIPVVSGFGVRLGTGSLTGTGSRAHGIAAGLDYFVGGDDAGFGLSLDYLRRPHANTTGMTRNLLDIQGRSYVGVGAGVYHVRARGIDGGVSGETGFGMKLTAGYVFSRRFLIQTDYHLPTTSQINGFRGRGFAITAGVFMPAG